MSISTTPMRDDVRPQQGDLRLWTEFGIIDIEPGEIAVIPRGVKIRVELTGPAAAISARTMAARSPAERGPIGANCLANPRDFLTPVGPTRTASPSKMYVKWGGRSGSATSTTRRSTSSPGTATRALQIRPAQLFARWPGPV